MAKPSAKPGLTRPSKVSWRTSNWTLATAGLRLWPSSCWSSVTRWRPFSAPSATEPSFTPSSPDRAWDPPGTPSSSYWRYRIYCFACSPFRSNFGTHSGTYWNSVTARYMRTGRTELSDVSPPPCSRIANFSNRPHPSPSAVVGYSVTTWSGCASSRTLAKPFRYSCPPWLSWPSPETVTAASCRTTCRRSASRWPSYYPFWWPSSQGFSQSPCWWPLRWVLVRFKQIQSTARYVKWQCSFTVIRIISFPLSFFWSKSHCIAFALRDYFWPLSNQVCN